MRNAFHWILGCATALFTIFIVDDFFLLSFSAIVFTLPLFLIVEVVYIVFSYVRNRKIHLVLSWYDLPTICLSIAAWGCIVSVNPMGYPSKSLANLMEPAFFTSVSCVQYAIRCYHAFSGDLKMMKKWGRISSITVFIAAILFAFLFPGIPE